MSGPLRDFMLIRPVIETTEGRYVRVSYSESVEGAEFEAEKMDKLAERMGLKVRYRVRGNHA